MKISSTSSPLIDEIPSFREGFVNSELLKLLKKADSFSGYWLSISKFYFFVFHAAMVGWSSSNS